MKFLTTRMVAARSLVASAALLESVQKSPTTTELLDHILTRTRMVLKADRGDFALANADGELVLKVVQPRQPGRVNREGLYGGNKLPEALKVNQILPDNSFMHAVYFGPDRMEARCQFVEDIEARRESDPDFKYYPSDSRVVSMACVRFSFKGASAGALHVEWFKKLDAGQERIVKRALCDLADYAALCLQLFEAQAAPQELVSLLPRADETAEALLNRILKVADESFGVPYGLIYTYDPKARRLDCRAQNVASNRTQAIECISYTSDAKGIPPYLVRDGSPSDYFTPDIGNDPNIDPDRVRLFGAEKSAVAMRLECRGETVGVYVGWGDERRRPTPDHLAALRPLARLAGFALASRRDREALTWQMSSISSLLNWLPFNIVGKDLNGTYVYANVRYAQYLGKSTVDEILGKSDADFYAPAYVAAFAADDKQVIDRQRKLDAQWEYNLPGEGRNRSHVCRVKTPILDRHDKVVGVQCIFAADGAGKLIEEMDRVDLQQPSQAGAAAATTAASVARYFSTLMASLQPTHRAVLWVARFGSYPTQETLKWVNGKQVGDWLMEAVSTWKSADITDERVRQFRAVVGDAGRVYANSVNVCNRAKLQLDAGSAEGKSLEGWAVSLVEVKLNHRSVRLTEAGDRLLDELISRTNRAGGLPPAGKPGEFPA